VSKLSTKFYLDCLNCVAIFVYAVNLLHFYSIVTFLIMLNFKSGCIALESWIMDVNRHRCWKYKQIL